MAQRGDLIGCRILFNDDESRNVFLPVSFTLNGRVIGEAKVKGRSKLDGQWTENEFYPFIGMGSDGITLLFKVCRSKKFFSHDFKIMEYAQARESCQICAIS